MFRSRAGIVKKRHLTKKYETLPAISLSNVPFSACTSDLTKVEWPARLARLRSAGKSLRGGLLHETYSASPRPELKPYVRAYAQRRIASKDCGFVQPVPACLEQMFDFEFGVPPIAEPGDSRRFTTGRFNVVGPSAYRPFNLHMSGGVESFAIFFQPLAFWQLFQLPLNAFVNRNYEGDAVLGREADQLWIRMAENTSFTKRVELVEAYLSRKAMNAKRNTSTMNAALHMFRAKGSARMADVAGQLSLGVRQFERKFTNEIGLGPKLYSRVARFQAVFDTKLNNKDARWADLAVHYGYHDQTHMIKDFQKLSGLTPETLMSQIGDQRPSDLTRAVDDDQRSHLGEPGLLRSFGKYGLRGLPCTSD